MSGTSATLEKKWRLLFEQMTTGFALHEVILDAQGKVVDYRFLEINPAYESLTGLKAVNLIGRTVLEVLPGTEQYWIDVFGRVAMTGQPTSYENYSKELGRWYSVRVFCPMTGQFAVIVSDITDRIDAQERLKSALGFSRQLVSSLRDGFFVLDKSLRLIDANPALCELTGFSSDELMGKDFFSVCSPSPAQGAYKQASNGEAAWSSGEYEATLTRKSGTGIPVWISPSVVRDGDSNILNYIGTVKDISERKKSEEAIRQLALYDQLTQLPNRRLFGDRLNQALSASERSQNFGLLLLLDLDHFKKLNDSRGHQMGDQLLMDVAQRLAASVRKEDTVCRLGGDEFVIVVEDFGQDQRLAFDRAANLAQKLRETLNAPYTLSPAEQYYMTTASIGVTLFRGTGTSMEVLLRQADVALYDAKRAGRNTFRFFDPAMQAAIDHRVAIEEAIRKGIQNGEFRLHYQAQVNADEEPFGAEALIRWQHPHRGLMSPAEFIPLAEESGLIRELGLWVLQEACRQLVAWAGNPKTRSLQLAVNVSAHQFHQPDFTEVVKRVISESGANPHQIKLELTESALLGDMEQVIASMTELSRIGIGFSLDDFGTGYSSLSYLKRLPLNQIKIDQSFVSGVPSDPNDSAIVKAILAMANSLGVSVIAEGVETQGQKNFLRESGCTAFQGYLFGKPRQGSDW